MNIIIEPLKKQDFQKAISLIREVTEDNFKYEGLVGKKFNLIIEEHLKKQKQRLKLILKNPQDYFLVAKTENKIIATMGYTISLSDSIKSALDKIGRSRKKMIEIVSVFVKPDFQKKGIGSRLLKRLLKKLKQTDFKYFSLNTGYIKGESFWQKKFGRPTIILKKYYQNLGDCWVWIKKIK